jgi:hypothetical protein
MKLVRRTIPFAESVRDNFHLTSTIERIIDFISDCHPQKTLDHFSW